MLKSTYKTPVSTASLLPEGWTEHKAPTGHSYFYNSATKESTYDRPASIQPLAPQTLTPAPQYSTFHNDFNGASPSPNHLGRNAFAHNQIFPGRNSIGEGFKGHRRQEPLDRPKTQTAIPGCEPWILVKTKLGRRFIHNRESGESFWRFPPDVMRSVIDYDRQQREEKDRKERDPAAIPNVESATSETRLLTANAQAPSAASRPSPIPPTAPTQSLLDSDGEEYEEVEVTDDEDEEGPYKRQKTENEDLNAPVEFNEEDIAYQLAAMGQDYGLEPGEYDDGREDDELEEGAEGLPLTEEDSSALFKDMLDDHQLSPYCMWDKVIEEGRIVEDDRYTVLPNTKTRKEVFAEWSRERIQRIKDQRAKEEKKDPRIPYLAFLESKATPKLYWPEFRRKYQKEPDMKNTKLLDKDREKAYREYINRLKLPESILRTDLVALLKSTPIDDLNRSSTLDTLPAALLTDLRYTSLRSTVRNPLIEAHISSLPPAPITTDILPEEIAARVKVQNERERRERALAQRQQQVEEEKKKQKGELYRSKGMLREGEEEIQQAMQVGKEGLLSHMEPDG